MPTLAFAAKYCAVTLHNRPTAAISTSAPKQRNTVDFWPAIAPESIIFATTMGTSRSKSASSSLNSGASMLSLR